MEVMEARLSATTAAHIAVCIASITMEDRPATIRRLGRVMCVVITISTTKAITVPRKVALGLAANLTRRVQIAQQRRRLGRELQRLPSSRASMVNTLTTTSASTSPRASMANTSEDRHQPPKERAPHAPTRNVPADIAAARAAGPTTGSAAPHAPMPTALPCISTAPGSARARTMGLRP